MWRRVERGSAASLVLDAPVRTSGGESPDHWGSSTEAGRSRAARTYQCRRRPTRGARRRADPTGRPSEGAVPSLAMGCAPPGGGIHRAQRSLRSAASRGPAARVAAARASTVDSGVRPASGPVCGDHHPGRRLDPGAATRPHPVGTGDPSGGCVEADFSAQQPEAQEEARLPPPHAHPRGSRRDQGPAPPGPGQALGLIRRVRGRETFRALAGARRHRAGPVAIRVLRCGDAAPPAVAYAIGRPAGNAVVRNRLRRRLREAVRAHAELLEPGCSYLVGAGAGAVALNPAELDRAVIDALRGAAGSP